MVSRSLKSEVSCEIDTLKVKNPNISYLELCLTYAEANDIEPEDIHKYINETLLQKIEVEASKSNLLKSGRKGNDLTDWL